MDILVWANFTLLFLAGGLTPGPAVILVTTASIRYGFWASMAPAAEGEDKAAPAGEAVPAGEAAKATEPLIFTPGEQ